CCVLMADSSSRTGGVRKFAISTAWVGTSIRSAPRAKDLVSSAIFVVWVVVVPTHCSYLRSITSSRCLPPKGSMSDKLARLIRRQSIGDPINFAAASRGTTWPLAGNLASRADSRQERRRRQVSTGRKHRCGYSLRNILWNQELRVLN